MSILDKQRDFYIKEQFEKDDLISKKADDVFNNFFASIKSENQEVNEDSKIHKEEVKNISQINQEYNKEIKEEKSNKENVINFEEAKEKRYARKKLLSAVASFMIIFIGANVYAATMGYNNIFFIIRDFVNEQIITDKDEILSDRDITISYKSIEIAKGIKMQINRLVVEENTAKLFIKVDKSNTNLNITPFTYIITDENGNELSNYISTNDYYVHTEEIVLNNFRENTEIINLNIKSNNGADLVKLKIDLVNQEIEVIGSEKELERISEVELKKYLGAFAFLNFEDELLNENTLTDIELENERNVLVAREIADLKRINIYTDDIYGETENEAVFNPNKIHKMISSFTSLQTEDDGLMKLAGVYSNKNIVNGKLKYTYKPNYDGKLTGLCLDVKNIIYSQGIYTVTYTYCYPCYAPSGDSYQDGIENLPVYEMTIGLTINEDDEYSKYFVSSKMESNLIKEGKKEVNEEGLESLSLEDKLEFYLNLRAMNYAAPETVLNRLDLISYEEFSKLSGNPNNRIENFVENYIYIKTDTKYSAFEEKMLNYCTKEMLEKDFSSFKNYNGYLAVNYCGATGYNVEVLSLVLETQEYNNFVYVAEIKETEEIFVENRTIKVLFYLEDGEYIISSISNENIMKDTENPTSINDNPVIDNKNNNIKEPVYTDKENYSESEKNESFSDDSIVAYTPQNVDNYASSMSWSPLYTPGLKTRVPSDWNVEVKKSSYTGQNDNLEVATVVKGVARGINKETNEIINSNVTIKYHMPDMMDYLTNVEDYTNLIADKYTAINGKSGYSSKGSNGIEWMLARKSNNLENPNEVTYYYCHVEPTDNGTRSVGYVVEIYTDNINNYKVTNILNWIFGDIITTSF